LSPDHIVYSGHRPCIVHAAEGENLATSTHSALRSYLAAEGVLPKVVLFAGNDHGRGAVAVGTNEKKAHLAELLFLDALKVLRYSLALHRELRRRAPHAPRPGGVHPQLGGGRSRSSASK